MTPDVTAIIHGTTPEANTYMHAHTKPHADKLKTFVFSEYFS